MKRTEPLRIDTILDRMIAATGLSRDFTAHTVASLWPKVVGPHIAAYTGRTYVSGRVLHVYINSAPLKEELGYARPALVEKLNLAVGEDAIDDVLFH